MASAIQARTSFILGGERIKRLAWQTAQPRSLKRALITTAAFGKKTVPTKQTVEPQPSYAIPAVLTGIAAVSATAGAKIPAAIIGLFGAFIAFQASNVRLRFEPDALEVVFGKKGDKGENFFVGGENRWKYSTFTNWEFWWPNFPVIVYFKETQTKPEGQVHFFVAFFNGKQLYDIMLDRCGPTKNSAPKA